MKPVVNYKELIFCYVGGHALVQPENHPSVLVSNKKPALTSVVVAFDEKSGEFETRNTLYRPLPNAKRTDLLEPNFAA